MVADPIKELHSAILNQDTEAATKAAKNCLAAGVKVDSAIQEASKAMTDIGVMFDRGEVFLPQVVMSADAMKAAADILFSKLTKKPEKLGKILIGTVEGDVHDVGKGIVAVLLDAAGFDVTDIGRDAPTKLFIEKTKELKPQIVGASALMTVTRVGQKAIVDALKKEGLKDEVKVMVGGGATTQVWASQAGADAWGEDAPDAVRKAKKLLGIAG